MSDNLVDRNHFSQLMCMYIDIGTETVLKVFYRLIPKDSVGQFLSNPKTIQVLKGLKSKRVLTSKEFTLLTTSNPNPDRFDISLLITLSTLIPEADLPAPLNGWHKQPKLIYQSVAAELSRLRKIRNNVLCHCPKAELPEVKFEHFWRETEASLLRLIQEIHPEEETNLKERIKSYRHRETDITKYLTLLDGWDKEINDIQKQIEAQLINIGEFKAYLKDKPVRFMRYIKLLIEGGGSILSAFLQNELTKRSTSFENWLKENEELLKSVLNDDSSWDALFSNTEDYAQLDILLLAKVIRYGFKDLDSDDIEEIKKIQHARENYAEIARLSLDSDTFADYREDLIASLMSLSRMLNKRVRTELKKLIKECKNRHEDTNLSESEKYIDRLRQSGMKIKTLTDVYKETILELKKSLEQMQHAGIDLKRNHCLEMKIQTACKKNAVAEKAECDLFQAIKEAMEDASDTVGKAAVRIEVKRLLDLICGGDGVEISDVYRGCIIIRISCSSIDGILHVIGMFENEYFNSVFRNMSSEMTNDLFEIVSIHASLTLESLCEILVHKDDDCHKEQGISIPLTVTSAEGLNHVISDIESSVLNDSVSHIAETLSSHFGKRISLQISTDFGDGGLNLRNIQYIPDESDPYYLKLYTDAISKGEEKDTTIRVNVVGCYGQGKTTLTRRLIQDTVEHIASTQGVEIIHCKYDFVRSSITCCATKELEDEDDLIARIASVAHSELMKKSQTGGNQFHQSPFYAKESIEIGEIGEPGLASHKRRREQDRLERSYISQVEQKKFSMLLQNSQKNDIRLGNLDIWDFGGQFIYLATQNLFHSRQAVYVLVFDLTKPLNCVVKDFEFPDEEKSMEQYAKFWIDSIHAYVGSENGQEPPVILVGTHKDRLEGDEHAKQEYIEEYFEQIRVLFENTNMIRHIQPTDFAVDNTNPNDNGIVELRKEVIQQGTKLAEKSIPANWIPLERAIRKHMHRKIISFQELMDIDARNEFPLNDEEQVKLFLRYHHSKGTLLYYDEEPISMYVVLDTQYLIDAFKCIITSKRFCRTDHDVRYLWNVLTKEARLENELIDKLWSNDPENDFLKHKRELVMFLEKHLIISEALAYCEESQTLKGLGWYIVPSLLRSNSREEDLTEFLTGRRRTSVRFVMSFSQSPLVQVLFYRLLAALFGKWSVVQISIPRKNALIYGNLGVFRLDVNHAGIVEYKYNDIELCILSLTPSLNVDSECADKFRRFSESVVENEFMKFRPLRTQQEKPYSICFRCNNESHGPGGGRNKLSLEYIREGRSEPCPDMMNHVLDHGLILSEWFLEDKIKVLFPERQFSEKELSDVALAIGQNWELIGLELGLQMPQIQRIDMDERTSVMKIFIMLLQWKYEKGDEATIKALIHAMKTMGSVSVDWDKIRTIVDKINSEGI